MSFKMSYFKIIISKALFINKQSRKQLQCKRKPGRASETRFSQPSTKPFSSEKSVDQGTFQPVKEKSVARRSHILTGTLKPEERDKKGEKCLEQN